MKAHVQRLRRWADSYFAYARSWSVTGMAALTVAATISALLVRVLLGDALWAVGVFIAIAAAMSGLVARWEAGRRGRRQPANRVGRR